MGCWGITAFESDAGLDSADYIRRILPQDGKAELGIIIEALQREDVRLPDAHDAESHTSPMALAEIVVQFMDRDIGNLDYDEEWASNDPKFSAITTFSASKKSIQWLRDYLSDTLKYARENAEFHKWNGWFEEKNWIGWQEHMTNLVSRLDLLLESKGDSVELLPPKEQNEALDNKKTENGLICPAGEQAVGQELKAQQWRELAESPNPLLALASRLYEQTDGLYEAGAGPGGIGVVSNSDGGRIRLLLSFDPPPLRNDTVFPTEVEQYQVRVTGCWAKSGAPIRPEELEALLHDPDPATQKAAGALWEMTQETRSVSTEECNEAFGILADWQLRNTHGTSDGTPNVSQKTAEEPESGPTMCQL